MQSDLADIAVSLVVPTFGRTWQLARLFDSLEAQTCRRFEVIVADQNAPGVLDPVLARRWSFPIRHLATAGERGISRARNAGWRLARGAVVLFPDDDAWYPPWFLDRGLALIEARRLDILAGRSADEAGRSINGRYAPSARPITRAGVWTCQIEWATLVRRPVLELLGGYDEAIGIGGTTPWQAAEGPDLILRALDRGLKCGFDPGLFGCHDEYQLDPPSPSMIAKGRAYGRGMGHVLRRNGAGLGVGLYWTARALFNLAASLARLRLERARYFAFVALGRWEGWTGGLWPVASPGGEFGGRDRPPAGSAS